MFYRSLEQDSSLKEFFHYWIQKTSLTVELSIEQGWKEIGAILPEANIVPFTRAVRLLNLDDLQRPLMVRLSSMTDVWHIDAISVDYDSQELLPILPLNLTSANTANDSIDIQKVIANSDSLYTTIMPSEYIDLTFRDGPSSAMQNPNYIVSVQGYFYEWFPKTEDDDRRERLIPDWLKGMEEKKTLDLINRQENRWLWSIYSKWKEK